MRCTEFAGGVLLGVCLTLGVVGWSEQGCATVARLRSTAAAAAAAAASGDTAARTGLPVAVAEEHHEVMPTLAAALPEGGDGVLVHFDSHPDLSLPRVPPRVAARVAQRAGDWAQELHPFTDIADWILPLVVAGQLGTVVWVSPPWCNQFDTGRVRLRVVLTEGGRLFVTCGSGSGSEEGGVDGCDENTPQYFEASGLWMPANAVREGRDEVFPFTLHVLRGAVGGKQVVADVGGIVGTKSWVLDVDEDYFSCTNPVATAADALMAKDVLSALSRIMAKDMSVTLSEAMESVVKRRLTTESDERAMKYLIKTVGIKDASWFVDWYRGGTDGLLRLSSIPGMVDNLIGLPLHVPAEDVLRDSLDLFGTSLKMLSTPSALLVARSEGFVPHGQTTYLHAYLMDVLESVYPTPIATDSKGFHAVGSYVVLFEDDTCFTGRVLEQYLTNAYVELRNGTREHFAWGSLFAPSPNLRDVDRLC